MPASGMHRGVVVKWSKFVDAERKLRETPLF